MSAVPVRTNGAARPGDGHALVTGGAGFIGSNVAARLLSRGQRVVVLDDLSRSGVEKNVRWLERQHGGSFELRVGDVRDPDAVARAVAGADRVFHFAAQVAVTTSIVEPTRDFEVNACGTLNVLEAVRASKRRPPVVYTSTNKVYGAIGDVPLRADGKRYVPVSDEIRRRGIGEERPLDFYSPYGCSKGTADQYVLDYARTFGLSTVVLRMSCIYGPRQFGTEDQGWVAHFLVRALAGEPIRIYGDGRQVRDVLFVDDLVDALLAAEERATQLAGRAFNVGGGPENTVSLLELLDAIERLDGKRPATSFGDWRVGDQRYYVSSFARFEEATGWRPRTRVEDGLRELHAWLREGSRPAPAVEASR